MPNNTLADSEVDDRTEPMTRLEALKAAEAAWDDNGGMPITRADLAALIAVAEAVEAISWIEVDRTGWDDHWGGVERAKTALDPLVKEEAK